MRSAPAAARAGRSQVLDALRGVAVVLVLVHHAPERESSVFLAGWSGVDLFFVLSGFLVSGLLFKEHIARGRISAFRFYLRRGFKIYPNFYFMLAVTTALAAWARAPFDPARLWHEALFVQNYLPAAWWAREHGWSLAVEEHFYVLLPPVIALLVRWKLFQRSPARTAAFLMAAIALVVLAGRVAMLAQGAGTEAVLFRTHARLDGLAFGVTLSVVWHYAPGAVAWIRRWRVVLFVAGLLLTAPSYLLPHDHPLVLSLGLTANYVGYGLVLAAALTVERPIAGGLTRPLAFIGFYSYSIYLWHYPFLALVLAQVPARPWDRLTFYAGSVALGVLAAKLVELPALRIRERFFPAAAAGAKRA